MARDQGLEDLIRNDLPRGLGLTEKAMFGGLAWLVDGHLALGARSDGMLVRLGKDNDGWALALPDVGPMMMRDRVMDGWVRAGPAAYGDDALRARLIEAALSFAKGLPPKG
jgi:TfoX N-terminal domain